MVRATLAGADLWSSQKDIHDTQTLEDNSLYLLIDNDDD